jgi:GAF domain-containing protein
VLPGFKALRDRERRLARAYWTLAQCNRILVRASSEPDLLNQLCKLLVQVGEYQMAWVGFAEDDAEHTVRCVAQAGFSDGYLESVRITWADDAHGRGPTGTCIRTGKPVVNRNTLTEPTFEPWRAQAMERGFQSSISLPLVLGKRCAGALMVYSSRVDAFDPDEQELMLRLSEDLAFGIGALRDREERQRAEARDPVRRRVSLEELAEQAPPESASVPAAASSETVLVVEDDDQAVHRGGPGGQDPRRDPPEGPARTAGAGLASAGSPGSRGPPRARPSATHRR